MWNSLPHSIRRAHSDEILEECQGYPDQKSVIVISIILYCFGNPIYYCIS